MSANTQGDAQRKERERRFHNEEFERHNRERLGRFYRVSEPVIDAFLKRSLTLAAGRRVLEFGCGPGAVTLQLASVARHVTAIDISETAISQARERARRAGFQNIDFQLTDAEAMNLPGGAFGFVCGRAILHHLDLKVCFPKLAQVLEPEGQGLFLEPLGHNPVIRWYRGRTPELRTADEHPLVKADLALAQRYFSRVTVEPAICFSLAAAALPPGVLFRFSRSALSVIDQLFLRLPGLCWWGWTSTWLLEGPRKVDGAQAAG